MRNIDTTTGSGQAEVDTSGAEKAAQAKHDTPEAVMGRLFGLLTVDGKAETLDFAKSIVPIDGDFIPPSIPALIRQGAPMSARRLTLADVIDCCMAMDARHLGELADKASDLVRSEGKRPPLPMPGEDTGAVLDGDVTILADLRQRVGEAIQRTELRWATGWQAKAAETMRAAYEGLLAVEDEALNPVRVSKNSPMPEPGEQTFTPAIIRAMEKLSPGGKAAILYSAMTEQQGTCLPQSTKDTAEQFGEHLKDLDDPKRDAVLLRALTDIIEAGAAAA
ncbi:MAG TPA: hypothetical protein VM238_21315 [Phycisphaerae bacterium]|nr:hypothetical protein [Phycisphaerae bacterium]